jgi:MFS family permease
MPVAVLCVAQFVVVLDATIVAIALPAMQEDLGLGTAGLAWVITAYTLVFGGCLLSAGRLADRAGRRRIFVAGLLLFAAASGFCGAATSGAALLAGRAAQGLGAALVAPSALALLTDVRPEGAARARALAWWTAAAAGGGASGWVLGGVLSGLLGWRWVFLINLPVCLLTAALAPRALPERRDATPAPADLPGALLATAALTLLVLALSTGTPALLPVAAALAAAFVAVERRAPDPLLHLPTIRRPRVATPNLVALTLTATTTPPMLLCTLHAQDVLGLDPATAGLLFPPFNLAVVAGSLAGPRVAGALGRDGAMAAGLAGVAAGALALRGIDARDTALPALMTGFAVMGAGLGVASVASTALGTEALDAERQGVASGLIATSAQVGTALGLALIVPLAATAGRATDAASVDGYRIGFTVAAAIAGTAALAVALNARRAASRDSPTPARTGPARSG